jgi:hypothetical protein
MASCRVPFKSRFNPDEYDDSRTAGLELFKMMIYPINVDMFYRLACFVYYCKIILIFLCLNISGIFDIVTHV